MKTELQTPSCSGMLVFQALIGFEAWFKQKPDEKFVEELLREL